MHDEAVATRFYTIGETTIGIEATGSILDTLDLTLVRSTATEGATVDLRTRRAEFGAWLIDSLGDGETSVLDRGHLIPEVAGALATAMVQIARRRSACPLLRAVIIERESEAVAFVGDDWEFSLTIAAQLTLRKWRFVSPQYAFVRPEGLAILPVQKLLVFTSTMLAEMPLRYRAAAERSRWYSTRSGLMFYTIDPASIFGESGWSSRARLRSILLVNGRSAEKASIDAASGDEIGSYVPLNLARDHRITIGSVIAGGPIQTADAVAQWFDQLLVC